MKKTDKKRFWEKVSKKNGCWQWTSALAVNGYGVFWFEGSNVYAHRHIFYLEGCDIPSGMQVCHTCDNPSCVNPDHLFLGSPSDNHVDSSKKGRRKGQKLCEEDVRRIRDMHRSGGKNKDISRLFKLHPKYVHKITSKEKWAHVDH